MIRNQVYLMPIILSLFVSSSTFIFYLYGVWDFPSQNNGALAAAVACFSLAMLAGFCWGIRRSRLQSDADLLAVRSGDGLLARVIRLSFIVSVVSLLPRLAIASQIYAFSPSSYYQKVIAGLSDAYGVYGERFVGQPPGIWRLVNYAVVGTEFLSWIWIPLAILCWTQLTRFMKLFTVLYALLMITASIARGQNFGAFAIVIQIVVFVSVRATIRGQDANQTRVYRMPRRKLVRKFAIPVLGVSVLGAYFANTMASRVGNQYGQSIRLGSGWADLNPDSWLFRVTPDAWRPLVTTTNFYISHGYEGLARGMSLPFESTWGWGGSFFLLRNAESDLGLRVLDASYQVRLDHAEGYDAENLWHTAYLWLGNDLSIWSVPLVLFLLFTLFGRAWGEFCDTGNVFAGLMMAPMALFVSFISANNQLFGRPETIMGFLLVVVLWLSTSYKFRWRPPARKMSLAPIEAMNSNASLIVRSRSRIRPT